MCASGWLSSHWMTVCYLKSDCYSPEFELTVAKFTKSYVCSMLLLLFFPYFQLEMFHEMLIRYIHIFSFVHKILVTAPTIPVLTNNSWFIHWPNKEKSPLSLYVFRDAVYFKPVVTTGHVRARASLANKRLKIHYAKQMVYESRLIQIFIYEWRLN